MRGTAPPLPAPGETRLWVLLTPITQEAGGETRYLKRSNGMRVYTDTGEIAFYYMWFTFTFHLNCYITEFPSYPRSDRNFSSLFISWHELFTKSRNIRLRVRHEIQNFSPFPILVKPSLADAHGTPVSIIYPLCTAMKR